MFWRRNLILVAAGCSKGVGATLILQSDRDGARSVAARQVLKAVLALTSRDAIQQSCTASSGLTPAPCQGPTGAAGTKDRGSRGLASAACHCFCCLLSWLQGRRRSFGDFLLACLTTTASTCPDQGSNGGGLPTASKCIPIMHLGTGEITIEGIPNRNF